MAGAAHGVRALARPGEFRRRRHAAARPGELPIDRRMSRGPPSLALLSAVTALAFCGLQMVVPAVPLLGAGFAGSGARGPLVAGPYLPRNARRERGLGPA